MNIIFGIDSLRAPLTGIGHYTYEVATRLQNHPHVEALHFTDGVRTGLALPAAEQLTNTAIQSASALRAITPRPLRPMINRARRRLCDQKLSRMTNFICHGTNFVLPRSKPIEQNVVSVHDLSIFRHPELHPPERVSFMEHYLPRSVSKAAKVITISQAVKQEIVEFFGLHEDRIHVTAPGVRACFKPLAGADQEQQRSDQQRLAACGIGAQPFLLFVNGSDPRKNLPNALAAFREFKQSQPFDCSLVVTGAGRAPGIDDSSVLWLDYPPEETLAALYRATRALVFPSVYEGFGMPVVEALASGTPALISKNPALLEFSNLPGVVSAEADKVASLVGGLERIMSAHLAEQAMQGAATIQDRFTWDACTAATLDCYQELSSTG